MKIPFFSSLSQEKLHHVFLVLGLVFLSASVLGYAAFRAGYTFEISQFFASSCDPEQLSGSIDGGTVSITNNNGAPCDVHVTIWRVYKPAYDPEFISTQELHDSAFEGGLAPGATTQLSVGTPSCTYQFDIATGTVRTTLPYGNDLIDSGIISPTGLYCGESAPEETPIPTPVPTPTVVPPACAPATQTVTANTSAVITASGGTSEYSWSAPAGTPTSGTGSSLSVAYATPGTYTVTLSSGGNQATCSVVVAATATPTPSPTPTPSVTPSPTPSVTPIPTPTPSITPTPTPISTTPALSITKVVRLVNQNGLEVDSVAAQPGEPVEFVIRVSSNGAGTAFAVIARDLLPAGLVYQVGSTRIDDIAAGDGILTGGLPLGDMLPGRIITIRFRATLAPAGTFAPGTTMLTNVALARASNVAEVSDPAFVSVTQIPAGPLTLELTKLGRNQSRQEVAFHSPVAGAASEIINFSIRVRNPGPAPVTNIVVRDVVPQVITPVPQTVTLNGTPVPDQALATGVVVGTLAPGQEAFIVFSGRIAPAAQLPQGLMTVINTATLTATNIPTLTAQLPINITNYIGPVAQVPTGPGDSALLALIVSITLTLVYVGYLGTDVHRRKEASRVAKESRDQIDFRQ